MSRLRFSMKRLQHLFNKRIISDNKKYEAVLIPLHTFYCLIKLFTLRRFGFGEIRRFGNLCIRIEIFLQTL